MHEEHLFGGRFAHSQPRGGQCLAISWLQELCNASSSLCLTAMAVSADAPLHLPSSSAPSHPWGSEAQVAPCEVCTLLHFQCLT